MIAPDRRFTVKVPRHLHFFAMSVLIRGEISRSFARKNDIKHLENAVVENILFRAGGFTLEYNVVLKDYPGEK